MFEHLFDPTIHLSDLLMIGGGAIAVLRLFWKQQQQNDKVLELLGKRDIRERRAGILGDIQSMEENAGIHADENRVTAQQVQEIRQVLGLAGRG